MRIFLDANLLFSAAKSDGAVRKFIKLLLENGHTLTADPYIQEEAQRNIQKKYSQCMPDLVSIIRKISVLPHVTQPTMLDPSIKLDEKDRPVLAAAISADCRMLVTGDAAHFGALYGKTVQGVTILSPRQAAEALKLSKPDP
jgi:predicted nucleic acid-binding protein